MFNYNWKKTDLVIDTPYKAFSCFAGGGGSSFGYTLNGIDVIGNCELDEDMNITYLNNHTPLFNFNCKVSDLIEPDIKLPPELYELDILDGSPPCSAFSMAGLRERVWGKKKKFTEGQEEQVLDELFFDFIELAYKLKPKVVISENVSGIMKGNAKKYVNRIINHFDEIGYCTRVLLCDAQDLGVPQVRKRVIFISVRNDIANQINCVNILGGLKFNIKTVGYKIPYKDIRDKDAPEKPNKEKYIHYTYWKDTKLGDNFAAKFGTSFSNYRVDPELPLPTIAATSSGLYDCYKFRSLTTEEIVLASSFPTDYNFTNKSAKYICGMSVPPVMMAHIIKHIKDQILDKLC